MTIDGPLMAQLRDIPMSSKSLVRLLDVLASHQPVHPELEALTQRRANDRLRKQRSRDRHVTVTVQSRDGHVTTAPPSPGTPIPRTHTPTCPHTRMCARGTVAVAGLSRCRTGGG